MGLNCTDPGGCRFPKQPCLASCSFTHVAEPLPGLMSRTHPLPELILAACRAMPDSQLVKTIPLGELRQFAIALGVQASEPALPDADVQDESGLLTYYSKDALAEYAQAWRDAYDVEGRKP